MKRNLILCVCVFFSFSVMLAGTEFCLGLGSHYKMIIFQFITLDSLRAMFWRKETISSIGYSEVSLAHFKRRLFFKNFFKFHLILIYLILIFKIFCVFHTHNSKKTIISPCPLHPL